MNLPFPVAILGAGLGSRMQPCAIAKPLVTLGENNLLGSLLGQFRNAGATSLICALREELLNAESKSKLPYRETVNYLYVNTDSSLHTLVELVRRLEPTQGPALFSMVDTVMQPKDLSRFLSFCQSLGESASALLVTPFVDDEKPLWLQVDAQGKVKGIGGESGQYISSGMYYLQPQAMNLARELVSEGMSRMRNFLSQLVLHGFPLKTFVVEKTIDVDHPSDLEKAEIFLRSN